MTPERLARLKITICAAELLEGNSPTRDQVSAFLEREGGATRMRSGEHHVALLGVTGTSTISIPAAFASWLRKANRKAEQADRKEGAKAK
jgi:hypothetical protein